MAVTSSPVFHHTDDSSPEQEWCHALADEARPLLDLDTVQRLVVLAAHPDDETLMAGGLIAESHRRGLQVDVVVASDGEASHPHSPTHRPADLVAVRRAEVREAVRLLAPTATLHTLGLGDGRLAERQEDMVRALVDIIAVHGKHTLLVSTWRGDGHPDHAAAARAASSAAWRTDARLLEAPIWLWHWGTPGQPLPGGPHLPLTLDLRASKRLAMQEHRSQVDPLSDQPGDDAILGHAMLSHFDRDIEIFFDGVPGEVSPFETLHAEHPDPWQVHSSFYESRKRALTMAALPRATYGRVLEMGCSVGALTADLSTRSERVLAMDESLSALRRAASTLTCMDNVELALLQVPEGLGRLNAELVVISEIGYFLSPARLQTLADRIASSGCHTVLACHWRHDIAGWPLDGPGVHRILRDRLGMPHRASVRDADFVLDVFSHDEGVPQVT